MLDFLSSPFKAIYNLDTYIKATKQSVWRSLSFLIYTIVLTSILFFVGVLIKTPALTPILQEITTKVAQSIPDIEIKNGVITANNGAYYEIKPEDFDKKIVFDTSRTEPVYPTQMQQNNIAIFVTAKTIYIDQQGRTQIYNLSEDTNFTLNEQVIMDNQDEIIKTIKKFLYLIALFSLPIITVVFMFILMILAILACAISQLFLKAEVSFGDICSICCYMLAPALFLIFIAFLLNIPFVWVICFVLFMIYSQLVLTKIKTQQLKKEAQEE